MVLPAGNSSAQIRGISAPVSNMVAEAICGCRDRQISGGENLHEHVGMVSARAIQNVQEMT